MPITSLMVVVVRNPIGVVLVALMSLLVVAYALSTLDDKAARTRAGNEKVREIRASSAPLLASDLAGFVERRRRVGATDPDPMDAWLGQFAADSRGGMEEWLEYHSARVGPGWVETSSGPDTDGWYRLEVDRRAGRVELTCGGSPAPGCHGGRWSLEPYGYSAAYLLGGR